MSSTWNYTTTTELENLLLLDIDSTFESQVETWIGAAEQQVNNYLGFVTSSGLWQEQISGEMNDARVDGGLNLIIHPRKRPVNSLSSLQLWKGSDSITLDLTDNSTNRYIIPVQANVIVYPNDELSVSGNIIISDFHEIKFSRWYTKIDYIAGYTTIPKDISYATTLLASDIFMRHANKEGLTASTQGRITKRWRERSDGRSDLQLDAFRVLDHYRVASGWF